PSTSSVHARPTAPVDTRNGAAAAPTVTTATLLAGVASGACWRTQTYWLTAIVPAADVYGTMSHAPHDDALDVMQYCANAAPETEIGTWPEMPRICAP